MAEEPPITEFEGVDASGAGFEFEDESDDEFGDMDHLDDYDLDQLY